MTTRLFPCVAMMIGLLTTAAVVSAGELELATGEVLQGQVRQVTDDQIVFDHPVLGELVIPRDRVVRFELPEPTPQAQPAEQPAEQPAVDVATDPADVTGEELIPPARLSLFEGWDSQISLGFSGTQGDNRTHAINTQFRTRKENDYHRWLIGASYFYGADRGNTTQNTGRFELTKDWLFPDSPWLFFVQGGHQYDQFRPWKHRTSGYGGVGYEFVKTDDLEIIGRLGLGTNYEYRGDNRGFTPEALLGASVMRWNITPNQTLIGSATMYPNLEDHGDFRLDAALEWVVRISHADGLSLKLGVENQYETDPGGDSKKNNFKYYGAIVLDF